MQPFLDSRHLAQEKELDRFMVVTSPDELSPRTARAATGGLMALPGQV